MLLKAWTAFDNWIGIKLHSDTPTFACLYNRVNSLHLNLRSLHVGLFNVKCVMSEVSSGSSPGCARCWELGADLSESGSDSTQVAFISNTAELHLRGGITFPWSLRVLAWHRTTPPAPLSSYCERLDICMETRIGSGASRKNPNLYPDAPKVPSAFIFY